VADEEQSRTLLQRRQVKRLARVAQRGGGDASLSSPEWEAWFVLAAQPTSRLIKLVLRSLPSTPRCGYCGAPFAGLGGKLVRPFGFKPSRKNPNICATCVELAPPGGTTLEVGVLFADLRGFTSASESASPAETGALLRRFYAMVEDVLLPGALIDKVVGDEVMALYVPQLLHSKLERWTDDVDRGLVARLMLDHAHQLLHRAGYGTPEGPAFELGIGLDLGEVFLGNIGEGSVRDFTAVGDVVNTASRLQSAAASGEVVVSGRLAAHLDAPPAPAEELVLKGKQDAVVAHRVRWFAQ
jgi:adenylate cyclase